MFGEMGAEEGEIGRVERELFGDSAEGVGQVVFLIERECITDRESGEECGPGFPSAEERRGGAKVVKFGEDETGIVGQEGVRIGVGDTRGEVVRLVEHEKGFGGIPAGLVKEEAAVGRGEDVVVVTDPDVLERKGGAGDLVGADHCVAAGGTEGIEVAGGVFEEIKPGESAARPALIEVAQVGAAVANAVKGVVDAVFAFWADGPGGDGGAVAGLRVGR